MAIFTLPKCYSSWAQSPEGLHGSNKRYIQEWFAIMDLTYVSLVLPIDWQILGTRDLSIGLSFNNWTVAQYLILICVHTDATSRSCQTYRQIKTKKICIAFISMDFSFTCVTIILTSNSCCGFVSWYHLAQMSQWSTVQCLSLENILF